jgi:hypothetical protein
VLASEAGRTVRDLLTQLPAVDSSRRWLHLGKIWQCLRWHWRRRHQRRSHGGCARHHDRPADLVLRHDG